MDDSQTQPASLLSSISSSPTEIETQLNGGKSIASSSNGTILHLNGGTTDDGSSLSHLHVDVDVDNDDGYVSGKEEFEDNDFKNPIEEEEDAPENKASLVGLDDDDDDTDTFLDSSPIPMPNVSTPAILEAGGDDNNDDDDDEKASQGEFLFVPEEEEEEEEEEEKVVQNASFQGNNDVADFTSPAVDVSKESGIIADNNTELKKVEAPAIWNHIPSNEHEHEHEHEHAGHEIEKFLDELVETASLAKVGAFDLVSIDDLGKFQPDGGTTEALGSIQKPGQFSNRVEDVPTEVDSAATEGDKVIVNPEEGSDVGSAAILYSAETEGDKVIVNPEGGSDVGSAAILYSAATEGDGVNITTKEGSAVGSVDSVHTPQEKVCVAGDVKAIKDSDAGPEPIAVSSSVSAHTNTSELDALEGSFDDNIRTSTVTAENYVSENAIIGDPESEPSKAVLENSDDEKTDIPQNEHKTEAISDKSADRVANTASLEGFHMKLEAADGEDTEEEEEFDGSVSDGGEIDDMIFGSSEAAKQFMDELELSGAGSHTVIDRSSYDQSDRMDGQIVTDSDEEVETDEEGEGKELFDSAALAALLKAASSAGSDSGNITITSQDGSRLFSIERPAGLGSSGMSLRPVTRPTHPSFLPPSNLARAGESEDNLSEEEKKKLEKVQALRVKFLRIVQSLGVSSDESIAAQVLYRLALVAGRQAGQSFSLDSAKRTAIELEAERKDNLDFSVNVLIVGKSGVGKSATINSIFGEERASINAFEPATAVVKEMSGIVNGVKVKVFDTPGLKPGVMEQAFNRRVLSSINSLTKKNPPDIILYVDRLDTQTRDLNDLPLLKTITSSLGTSIWKNTIVTLTHAASAPPEGPSGSPLSYEMFVTQRSHVLQQCIGHAVGDLRMMSPSLMNPVSLVENHPSCRKNRDGQKVLPNGQTWRSQLLLLCFSMKMLSEANSLTKSQDPFDNRKLFGFRTRSPPLPYMLSSMLQSRPHPKLQTDQGIDNGDSDNELADLSDIEEEEEDEYDQLPPFKPLRKSQLAKLSREQRNAYFEEYDYRVKLLQKKQWKEELRRMREMKKKGKTPETDYGFNGEDDQDASPAPVATPLPDMALPPSFDSGSPAYRYRFLEPTSQFLARPVLDTHGWDHDCGYDGVNIEHALAILSQFPAAVSLQMTKDKKEFSLHFDSSVAAKHGDNGSSMLGFDIQNIGKQLAYIVRGETKFKTLKRNKTAAGMSVTFLGENMVTGFKAENQVAWGKQWAAVTSAGTVRCQSEAAYGANIEVQRREIDYPVGQVQSTYGVSLIRWRGDWALGFNTMAQFSAGRNSKVAVRAGINNKMSGQVTVRTSSSEQLVLALAGLLPIVTNIYKKIWPAVGGENYSIY
ncbi:translocase of chloroplast 159, chloroplastic-like isoform X2 [Impatiens glandulifera]|uniref:translocase of chloroplast 159, chloroplastic-like isoform X2 n=1 Tax=Impatiens glandulifera TaxID=253017 RepID=UPI001FB13B7B|nr:translocase of chloroplast 159, chloroplastic-like isoform X2 [Impatiens glandulifera]